MYFLIVTLLIIDVDVGVAVASVKFFFVQLDDFFFASEAYSILVRLLLGSDKCFEYLRRFVMS